MQQFDGEFVTIAVFDHSAWKGFNPGAVVVPEPEHHTWPTHATMAELHACSMKWHASAQIIYTGPAEMEIEISGEGYKLRYVRGGDDTLHLVDASTSTYAGLKPSSVQYTSAAVETYADQNHSALANRLKKTMPGLDESVTVPCACKDGKGNPLRRSVWGAIQHLNDRHHPITGAWEDKWSRERIAQWTEELPFDLTIDPERAEEQRRRSEPPTKEQEDAYIAHLKDMALSAATVAESLVKAMEPLKKAAKVTVKNLESLAKTFEVEFKSVSPEMYEMLTGMKYPAEDTKEES